MIEEKYRATQIDYYLAPPTEQRSKGKFLAVHLSIWLGGCAVIIATNSSELWVALLVVASMVYECNRG